MSADDVTLTLSPQEVAFLRRAVATEGLIYAGRAIIRPLRADERQQSEMLTGLFAKFGGGNW